MSKSRFSPDDVRAAVEDEPLVSVGMAAQMLGIPASGIVRLRQSGKLPAPVDIDRPHDRPFRAYCRSEVEALVERIAEERRHPKVRLTLLGTRVLSLLNAAGESMAFAEIKEALLDERVSERSLRWEVGRLVDRGLIARVGRGVYASLEVAQRARDEAVG